MTKEEEIKQLKKERKRLQCGIWEWKKRGKNAIELTYRYKEIIDRLSELGINTKIKSDYLKPEFYKDHKDPPAKKNIQFKSTNCGLIQKNKHNDKKEIKEDIPQEIKQIPKKNIYVLSIAWTDSENTINNDSFRYTLDKVVEYLYTLGLKKTEETFNEAGDNNIEKIIKFEFEGNDQSFQIVKLGAIYLLDTLSHNDYKNVNIAIFGKKRNY